MFSFSCESGVNCRLWCWDDKVKEKTLFKEEKKY